MLADICLIILVALGILGMVILCQFVMKITEMLSKDLDIYSPKMEDQDVSGEDLNNPEE